MFKLSLTDSLPAPWFFATQPVTFHLWFHSEKDALAMRKRAWEHSKFNSFDLEPGFPQWPETEVVKGFPVYEWTVFGFSRYLDRLERGR